MEPIEPTPTVEDALNLLDTTGVDAAILDIRRRNGLCFDVAQTLVARRVPFLTGSGRQVLPFRALPVVHKPCEPAVVLEALRRILSGDELPGNHAGVGRYGGSLQTA